jgi:putative photosynthetic complex assembly protein
MPQLQPSLTAPRDRMREMIPNALLVGMAALALSTLALVTFAVMTERPAVGVPAAGAVVQERLLILEGKSAQAVVVKDTDGTVLLDLPHGGFVTVIQSAMARARLVARTEGNPPLRIVRYDNGRLVAEDPATGWSAELYAFGQDNKAAFERLLDDTKE